MVEFLIVSSVSALDLWRRYAGVCRVDACARRLLPAECLEA